MLDWEPERFFEQGIVAMSRAATVDASTGGANSRDANSRDANSGHVSDPSARSLYDKLEDRILARDQVGASESYYALLRSGRPLTEMLRQAVRIHGPYTHVPYHE